MQSRILGGSEMMHGGFLKSSAKVQLFFDICKREHKKGVGVTPFHYLFVNSFHCTSRAALTPADVHRTSLVRLYRFI